MSKTTLSRNESSPITKIFEGETARTAAASPGTVCKFEIPTAAAPARTKSIADIVDRWNRDPERKAALRRGRARLANLVDGPNDLTLRGIRLRAGMSQTDVARAIGTSQSHIARIEGSRTDPALDTCKRLAAAFGVDLNTIGRALAHQGGVD